MRAIEITQFGAPEVLCETTRPDPVAGPGEVLIRVAAVGINRPDVLQRKGLYPMPPGASDLPGLEVAGSDRRRRRRGDWRPRASQLGDRVCALVAGGGYAAALRGADRRRRLPVPARPVATSKRRACPRPSSPSGRTCSTSPACKAGETLLVQGGSSGIGVTAIQLAKALGCHGHRHRRQRRQVRGLHRARRRPRHQLPHAGLRRRGASASPTSAASTSCSTWWPATTSRARSSAWPTTAASRSSRCRAAPRARSMSAPCCASACPSPARRCGRAAWPTRACWRAALRERVWPLIEAGRIKPVIHQRVPGGPGGRGPRADGIEHARRQDRPRLDR